MTDDPVEVTAEIENVGDVDDTQTVELDIEGLGSDAAEVELPFGESTEETLSVGTEEGDAGEYEAVVASEDDTDTAVVEVVVDTEFLVVDIETNAPIIEGEDLDVTATVENVGEAAGERTVELSVPGLDASDSATLELGPGDSASVDLSVDTEIEDAAGSPYEGTVTAGDDTEPIELVVHLPPVVGDAPPQDLNGDDLYEDVRGTGEFTIFDVQTLFTHLDDPTIQDHDWAHDFNGDDEVGILDVQALFEKLVGFDQTTDTSATRDSPESVSTEGIAVA